MKIDLEAVAREQATRAAESPNGHSADTVVGGQDRVLRHTIIGLRAAEEMSEHENPGEATVLVLGGSVRLEGDGEEETGRSGDLLVVPPGRHRVVALENAVLLFTVAKL
jgi:quercetin dioxygenase-like cupin family protein